MLTKGTLRLGGPPAGGGATCRALDAEARRLRVDLVFGDGADEAYLRLKRVTLRERPRAVLGGLA